MDTPLSHPSRVTRLPNGVVVVTTEMPPMTSVSLGIWVAVGGRHEAERVNGVSHFIEHLLFKGTRTRSAREISQSIEGIGGYLNAFTAEECTCFYSKAKHDRLGELLDVLVDMLLNSRFAPEDIEKERSVIREELAMYRDQPAHHVQELLNETLWPEQPLGRPLAGTEASVGSMTRAQLLGYHRSKYVGSAIVIAAAGNIRHSEHVAAVMRRAARFPRGRRPAFRSARNGQAKPRFCLFTKDTEQTQLALGVRGCSRHDERRYALRLLNAVLGENMSSRLFQVLREEQGLAYSVHSSLSFFQDTGDLVIEAGLDTANAGKALRLILREMRRLSDRAPSVAELRRASDYVTGQIDLSLENTESQMMWLGENYIGYGKVVPPAEVKRQLSEVTPQCIQRVARDLFRPGRLNLAMVSPLKNGAEMRRLLRGWAPLGTELRSVRKRPKSACGR